MNRFALSLVCLLASTIPAFAGSLQINGSSSGSVTVTVPAAAGSNTVTLPAGTTDFSSTGGAHNVVKQSTAGGAFTVGQLACADLSDSGAGCTGAGGGGGSSTIILPQGRLTLVTATPVLTADASSAGTLYYDCYKGGNQVPYYTGSANALDTIGSCEKSTAMATTGTGVLNSGGVFDVWWEGNTNHNICVATNGSGGGWASDTGTPSNTARGTGYSQLDTTTKPFITNANTIAHCYNGATDYGGSLTANKLTYLGTIHTVAAGKVSMTGITPCLTGSTAPPSAPVEIGIFNAYNTILSPVCGRDTSAAYSYTTNAFRALDNSANNAISWVDGLTERRLSADGRIQVAQNGSYFLSWGLDSTSTEIAGSRTRLDGASGSLPAIPLNTHIIIAPQTGYHTITLIEDGGGASASAVDLGENIFSAELMD